MLPFFVTDVPIHCLNDAAIQYHIPAKLIIAVLNTERGKIGTVSKNKNGTSDLGPMQINSRWLPTLAKYGYTSHDLIFDPCKNVSVGSWLLAKAIAGNTKPHFWQAVGVYHSHTPTLNLKYGQQVLRLVATANKLTN